MNKFILASGNNHKAQEFAQIFDKEVIVVESAPEKLDVVEDGLTYHENALKKAKAYFKKYKTPILADDSGLNVEALPEELGIYSARFGGPGLHDKDRANLLLEKMKDKPNRKAFFTCVLCFYLDDDTIYFFEGRMDGEISESYDGAHGFGYDPVFKPTGHPSGLTIAQLPEWKDEHSHRAKACQASEIFFRERNCQIKKDKL